MNNKTNIEDIHTIMQIRNIFEHLRNHRWVNDITKEIDPQKAVQAIENILADRERVLEENKQSVSYQTLCDYLINSVDETQKPIWTEAHIEELLDNFIIKWKEGK